MTGVSIIHTREVPSSHRKVIPTAIRRVVGRGRDRLSVLQIVEEVRRTLAIQTFHPVPIDLNPTAGLERVVKEVLASLQLMHTVIIPFLTVTHMVMTATASPIMLTVMRLLFGLSTPALQERFIITTVKQKSPSGRNQRIGLNEREETRRERTRKKEILLEPEMVEETLAFTESTWFPQNPANICPLQRVFTETIIALGINEMEIMQSLGICPVIRKKTCRDSVRQVTEDLRWSRHVQYTLQHFQQLCIGLLLLWQILAERQLCHQREACKMFHHRPLHLHDTNMYDHSSHTPSPNIITAVSPQVPQHHGVPSPRLHFSQQSPQFPPRHGVPLAQNLFPQVPVTGAPRAPQQYPFAPHQYVVPQQAVQPVQPQMNDYRQYTHMNSSAPPRLQVSQQVNAAPLPLAAQVPSPQPVMFNKQVSPQPALHPLQQATLVLQQRKMSEAQAAAAANMQQPYAVAAAGLPQQAASPITVGLHRKDDRSHHNSPGSPVVFSQQPSLNELTPHHSSQQLPPLSVASSNLVSSSPLSHSSNASSPVPVLQASVPTVNLQAIAKYVDKNLTGHLSAWPTEVIDRQLQKLWEDSSFYSNDSDKAKIEQIQLQSEVGFMEMRLETASKRISSLKGMTRTLEALLAESDIKFLSWS
ncbi:hypothetical protein OS493_036326 [Desmophyllum pertusum]|uniref:Uncharacterized protein n=1 Tax=Desmophyllum pertusum TaxID=174260 RepID=A0A9X0CNG8_9CNID|nr:hypothetical protein OS493_036326 [Desmophyllum pertusum]